MTALAIRMLGLKPREKAGARTGARFAFQVHASLAKLLDLYEAGTDYRAIFDYFDDLVVIYGDDGSGGLEFFQIKGREGTPWKPKLLCSPSGEKPRTIIGKMFDHTVGFGKEINFAVFLTNAPFEFGLANGGKSTPDHVLIAFSELAASDQAVFAKALELDFPSPRTPGEDTIIQFERTSVPVRGYDVFLKGRLVNFFDGQPGISIDAVYRTLVADITAKSNDTTECADLAGLFSHKTLCRSDFEALFSAAAKHRSILDDWLVVDEELRANKRSFGSRIRTKTAVLQYLRDRSKRDSRLVPLASAIHNAIVPIQGNIVQSTGLLPAANLIITNLDPKMLEEHNQETVEAALLTEAFEALNG